MASCHVMPSILNSSGAGPGLLAAFVGGFFGLAGFLLGIVGIIPGRAVSLAIRYPRPTPGSLPGGPTGPTIFE
jgi:hypothetical protein